MTEARAGTGLSRKPAGITRTRPKEKPLKLMVSDALEWMILVFLIGFAGAIPFQQEGSVLMNHESAVRLALYGLILLRCMMSLPEDIRFRETEIPTLLALAVALGVSLTAARYNIFYSIVRVFAPALTGLAVMMTIRRKQMERFMRKMVGAVTVIAALSVFFWAAGSELRIVKPSGTVSFLWDGEHKANTYWYLYYEPDWQEFFLLGRNTFKNCGIFAEPPMFGFLLCLTWMFHRIRHETLRESWLVCGIVGAAIVSTYSVTAVISILIFEAAKFGLKKSGDGLKSLVKFFVFLAAGIIALTFAADLVEDKLNSGSGGVRRAHLEVSLKAFLESPLTGIGFGRSQVLEAASQYNQGMSIGLPAVWALGGIGSVGLTLIPHIAFGIQTARQKQWTLLAFDITLLWIGVCTMIYFTMPFAWLILMYMCRDERPRLVRRTRRGSVKIEGRSGRR